MEKSGLFHPYTFDNIHPGFSIDCVVFSFASKKIRILLNKFDFSEYWQLPGGFMFKDESAEDAAFRILKSRTGVDNVYLNQFYLFSDPKRTDLAQNTSYIEKKTKLTKLDPTETEKWFLTRFVSLGYYSFVRYSDIKIKSSKNDVARWFDVNSLPDLYSDHYEIVKKAAENIRSKIELLPIAQELLPEKFTMSDLRKIYEIALNRKIDRRNFQRKVISSGIVIQLDEVASTASYNPAILYSFNKEKTNMSELYSFFK